MANERKSHNRGTRSRLSRWVSDPSHTIFTRTYLDVAKLVVFYVCFTSIIMALMCLQIYGLLKYIERHGTPWLELDDCCLGKSPGIGYRPALHMRSPLIWYKWTQQDMYYTSYVQNIELFMQSYVTADPSMYRDCDAEVDQGTFNPQYRKPCYFNVSNLGPCAVTSFGYLEQQPCIYLKFNRINDWTPDCYKKVKDIPKDMPVHLKEFLIAEAETRGETLWVSCEGYHPFDAEHLANISYYPKPGFKAFYFPYKGNPYYLSPIVAIKLNEVKRDILITVKCRAWAKNIADNSLDTGRIDFQVMVGEFPSAEQ